MFKFACPHCQQNISTEEDYSGKNVQCPTCGAAFVVPLHLSSALRIEEEIKVSSAPHPQPLGQNALKQPAYQAPQMKTPAGRRKGKGKLIVLVAAAIVLMGGVFWVMSHRANKQQIAKNIDAATSSKPFVNSLGMKFVPVPIGSGPSARETVLFSIWETRRQDYEAYAKANSGVDGSWKNTDFQQTATHPVVNVNYDDAVAFCQWLTEKERDNLPAGAEYRLPTDAEWSYAVGIGDREDADATPDAKSCRIQNVYPWDDGKGTWPPEEGAGNYRSSLKVDNYDKTSPVASFSPNRGLYDLGGNVYEWCGSSYDGSPDSWAVRGQDFTSAGEAELFSSFRIPQRTGNRSDGIGFRCVLVLSPR
jgi:DNA-directed RNA polymerase subunit RPC12/RpoP